MSVIQPGRKVSLHFSLGLLDGQEVDSTFGRQPASFVVGDGNFLPGFESVLIGLQAGDEKRFSMGPEDGFGMPNPNNVHRVPREQFADLDELSEGLVMNFADAAGAEVPGVITGISDTEVVVDFNHPLAGKQLVFRVNILAVEDV